MISTNNVRTKTIPTQGLSSLMTRGEGLTKLFWTVIISWADRKIQTNTLTPNRASPFLLLHPLPPRPNRKSIQEGTRRNVNLLTFILRSLKAERCDFGGNIRLAGEETLFWRGFQNPFKTRFPPLSFYYKEQFTAKSNSIKIAHKTAFEAKGRLYTTGKEIPRLFIIDLHTQLAIYAYRWGKR